MPGTLLRDDWQQTVGDELRKHAQGLTQNFQVVGNEPPRLDPNAVLQELQQHAQNVASTAQQATSGVVQFGQQRAQDVQQQLQSFASGLSQNTEGVVPFAPAQRAPEPITVSPAAPAAAPVQGGTLQDYARQQAQQVGLDPEIFVRQIQQESGFNPTAKSPAGATGIAQFMPATAQGMGVDPSDPYASLAGAARLMSNYLKQYQGDYAKALAAYNAGPGNVEKYGGVPPFEETQRYVSTILGSRDTGPYKPNVQESLERIGQGIAPRDISQFGDRQLTNSEAYAACGPAAAVRFAQRFGRNPSLREAVDLAKGLGWTEGQGMAGLQSEKALMDRLDVPTKLVQGAQWDVFSREAQSGNPVTISTTGHYFYADGYDPQSGAFHVGRSGTDLRGGKEWMTPADMEARMGAAQGGLLADSPLVPSTSSAASGSPVYTVGDGQQRAPVREPLVAGIQQFGGDEGGQQAARFQVVGDTLERGRQAVSQVVQDIQDAGRPGPMTAGMQPTPSDVLTRPTIKEPEPDLPISGIQPPPPREEAILPALDQAQQAIRMGDVQQAMDALGIARRAAATAPAVTTAGAFLGGVSESLEQQQRERAGAPTPRTPAEIKAGVPERVDWRDPIIAPIVDASRAAAAKWIQGDIQGGIGDILSASLLVAPRIAHQDMDISVPLATGLERAGVPSPYRELIAQAANLAIPMGVGGEASRTVTAAERAARRAEAGTAMVDAIGQWLRSTGRQAGEAVGQGVRSGQRAEAEAGFAAGLPRRPEAPAVPESSRVLYHGTAADYPSVEPGQRAFEGQNSLGPGHYLATDAGEASAYAERAQNFNPGELAGFVGQGANVRKVEVPASLRLFDLVKTDRDMEPTEIRRLVSLLEHEGRDEAAKELRYLADIADPNAKLGGDASPNVVFDALRTRGVEPREISSMVRQLGYDGIEHIDLSDGAHNVLIFPDALPKIRNAISGRQGGQALPIPAINLAGAAAGGFAGNVATPEGATPEERARNIALGAGAGFVGTAGATRLAREIVSPETAFASSRRAGESEAEYVARLASPPAEPSGFRAPGGPAEPPSAVPIGRAAPEPRTLGEVHSNPHTLREAAPGDTPLGDEQLMAHADQLEQRLSDVRARAEAVDEILRNPNQQPERPPWAAGYTNDRLIDIARKHGVSAYDERWWDTAGLETGSAEMRQNVGEGGFKYGNREPTPTELRAERNALAQEERDLTAAYDQLTTAPAGARFAARPEGGAGRADLPFDAGAQEAAPHGPFAVENAGPSGNLAADIVTRNGTSKRPSGLKGLWSDSSQVVGEKAGITGRGIVDVEGAGVGTPKDAIRKLMPNLDAMLGDEMPEVRAQIQKAVEDNPELFEAYTQGRISHESLRDDLARRVGMTTKDWNKTKVGQGFSTPELVALQAAAVDAQNGATSMAREILARGGVDALSPEEVAFGLSNLFDSTRLLAVARGGRATAGRSLNALKIKMDRTLARGITASNERVGARRTAEQARRAAVKATQLLDKTKALEQEAKQAVNGAQERGASKGIVDQIADAYDQLDRYQAMSLHEKADEAAKLAKDRAERAAARKEVVRSAPEELLSALKAELKAEQKIFAGRKDTWDTMAFWDTKANEIAAEKRRAFRGGLYIEAQRKAANEAAKGAEGQAARAWEAESRRQTKMTDRASTLLEAIGGEKPSRELLKAFTEAIASDDPMVAAKFLKGLSRPQGGFGKIVEIARNANVMRLAGMLSATATHVINAGGNVINVPLELGTHAGVVGIDILRSAITGGERQAYAAELLPMIRAYGPGIWAAMPDALNVLKTGITPSQVADLSKIRPGFQSGLPGRVGEVVDPAIEMPLRALQAEDLLFRGGAFGMHAQRVAVRQATKEGFRGAQRTGRANNIVANLEDYPELYTEVADAAARMVFQERRTVPGLARMQPTGAGGELAGIGVSQVMPFRMTPANIFSQGLGLSPAGVLGIGEAVGTRGTMAARVAAGEIPAERLGRQTLLAEQRTARAAVGTAILAGGMWFGTQTDEHGKPKGMLTAMYDEDESSTYPQGWRAWSLRTENPANGQIVYTPLQNFGVAGVPLAMAAILSDAQRRGKNVLQGDELTRAATGLGRYAIDNTMLQGLSDVVDMLHDPGKAGGKWVEGLVGSYGPYSGMGRQVQRAMGEASRNPREGFLGLLDALEANYPGLSENVPEATTSLGEPRTPGATGFGALVGRYDIERDEPTLRVLRDNAVDVPREPRTVTVGGGYGVELTEAERDTLKRTRGVAIRQAVEGTAANPRFAGADLAARNATLRAAVSAAAQSANNDFLRGLGNAEIRQRMKVTRELEPSPIGATP